MGKTRILTFNYLRDSKTGEVLFLEVPDDDIARRQIDAALKLGSEAADLAVADLKRMLEED